MKSHVEEYSTEEIVALLLYERFLGGLEKSITEPSDIGQVSQFFRDIYTQLICVLESINLSAGKLNVETATGRQPKEIAETVVLNDLLDKAFSYAQQLNKEDGSITPGNMQEAIAFYSEITPVRKDEFGDMFEEKVIQELTAKHLNALGDISNWINSLIESGEYKMNQLLTSNEMTVKGAIEITREKYLSAVPKSLRDRLKENLMESETKFYERSLLYIIFHALNEESEYENIETVKQRILDNCPEELKGNASDLFDKFAGAMMTNN